METTCARATLPSWRVPAAAALLVLALGGALRSSAATEHAAVAPAGHAPGGPHAQLLRLPATAQAPVSALLGSEDPTYRLSASAGELVGANAAQHLRLRFGRAGVSFSSGAAHAGLSLRAVGYGAALSALGPVTPRAHENRVVYAHGAVDEWYVNGPLGLEQGFTIPTAPSGDRVGPLTLSLALSGNVRARLAPGGQSVTLTRAGGPSLRYAGLSATDADGHPLHTWLQLSAAGLLLRVDARHARYPLRIDPFVQQGAKLSAESVSFGASVALSADGETALIGAGGDDGGAGAAWVFTRTGQTWSTGRKADGRRGASAPGDFGASVALSADGNTALIGGSGDDEQHGRGVGVHALGLDLEPAGRKADRRRRARRRRFGHSVALSADGEHGPDRRPSTTTARSARRGCSRARGDLDPAGREARRQRQAAAQRSFGSSVALSADGDTALIGAAWDNATSAPHGCSRARARRGPSRGRS